MVKQDVAADTSNRKPEDKWKDAERRTEKRLVTLLNCHQDDLPDHLRHTIGLLKSKEIPINWLQLLNDVQNWQRESRDVQRRWARQFWRNFQKRLDPELK
jgi:CRISPR type I-E-associated protein CasB/Cse2